MNVNVLVILAFAGNLCPECTQHSVWLWEGYFIPHWICASRVHEVSNVPHLFFSQWSASCIIKVHCFLWSHTSNQHTIVHKQVNWDGPYSYVTFLPSDAKLASLVLRSLSCATGHACVVPVDLGIHWIVFHVLDLLYNACEVPAASCLCYTLVNGYGVAERFEETLFNHLPFVPFHTGRVAQPENTLFVISVFISCQGFMSDITFLFWETGLVLRMFSVLVYQRLLLL